MEKQNKQYDTLKRNIAGLLKDFQKNKQWADIGNWLYRLQQSLGDKKFKDLPHHTTLAKRLAQCLNPNLPAGIHITALKIYTIILQNFSDRVTLIPLTSIGLFPFFQHSSSQLKNDLLKIFDEFFTTDHQSLQMIISLMNALLTGLNQKSQDLARRIYTLCDKISKINGRTWVDGAVWVNILRSPKVRIAGFKYFMKVFKDRDRIKNSSNQQKEPEIKSYQSLKNVESPKKENLKTQSVKQIQINNNKVIESQMYQDLRQMQKIGDNFQSRFPNFSTLVINALLACLQENDNLVKRAAMDMMINYLKSNQNNNKDYISRRDSIIMVQAMLQILKLKQFSLTHRMYKYLFDQPNMEGSYNIDQQNNKFQLDILKSAILNIFHKSSNKPKHQSSQNNMIIIETLITDHPILAKLLLPDLSFTIIQYIHKVAITKDWRDKIGQFYKLVIAPYKHTFVKSIVKDLEADSEQSKVRNIISNLDFYFQHIEKIYQQQKQNKKSGHNLSNSIAFEEQKRNNNSIIMQIIEYILHYLSKSSLKFEQASLEALQLSIRLYSDIKITTPFSSDSIELMNNLIISQPSNNIYASLLTLHPHPKKQFLFPFIHQGFLGTVCLNNLMAQQSIESEKELKDIFYAIFKLLNCHLWEDRGIEFIKIYSKKYPDHFATHINNVEPSDWLIYWRKMNGDVENGVIRMLMNINHESPLESNLSKKWLQSSQNIISKVIDPVFNVMKKQGIKSTLQVYSMLKSVFTTLQQNFTKFFFIQRDKYLLPLINHIFNCLDSQNLDLKSKSIAMMEFILLKTITSDQKMEIISLTLTKTLSILKTAIKAHQFLQEIQLLSYLRILINNFTELDKTQQKKQKLIALIGNSDLFNIVVSGMYQCEKPYVRTLYIEHLHETCSILGNIDITDKLLTSNLVNMVLQRLFIKLRQNDITNLEQIIKGKQVREVNRRKKSENIAVMVDKQIPQKIVLNVESTYAQVIELWNSVKFFTRFSIQTQIKQLPINQLISIILQSFPFSDLVYMQFNQEITTKEYESLQQEVKNVTGLKKQVLQIFAIIWQKYECEIIDFLIDKGDPCILVHAGIDPNLIIKALSRSSIMKTIKNYVRITKVSLPKGTLHYNLPTLLMENQLVYFLYIYLTYCNLSLVKSKKVGLFLQATLTLLRTIKISPHIQTKIWLYQIIHLLSERIPIKEVNLDNGRLKSQIQQIFKEVQSDLIMASIRSRSFTHRTQIKTGLFTMFSKEEKEQSLYDFVVKFPPTLHHLTAKPSQSLSSSIFAVENFTDHVLSSKCQDQTEENFINYLSIISIKTMIAISNQTLFNLYENDASKICLIVQEILVNFLPICKDKSNENQVYLELIAQYLHNVLNSSNLRQQVMKSMRVKIIDIYMGNDFFKCTKKTLFHWKAIIDYCTEKQDLLAELLCKEGLFQGIFTKKAQAMRLRIKSFQRVCFVIFSGKIDKYENKLWNVLESLNEVMKEEDPSPALLILILFCIRILFLRLSQSSLSRMFRSIWPGLMTLLVQIFRKDKSKKNVNLLLAGLKVIQLIHALELEQFHLHQWMFIFDYFGLRLSNLPDNSPDILTPFSFKPFLAHLLPHHSFKCSFIPQKMDSQLPSEPLPRRLVVKQSSIDSQQQLRNHAYVLMQYIIDLNQIRTTVSKQEIQSLIQGDFISLDDYIFQIQ